MAPRYRPPTRIPRRRAISEGQRKRY